MSRKSRYPQRRVASAKRYPVVRMPRARVMPVQSVVSVSRVTPLRMLEDRRQWSPDTRMLRPVMSTVRSAKRIVTGQSLTAPLRFADPRRVVVCVRRAIRREIMHAKGYAGSRVRRPKRTPWSSISCK